MEVELKFDLDPGLHAAFGRHPALAGAPRATAKLRAIYFDTPGFELRGRRMALRLRREGRRWVQCLKAGASGAGGLHARDEWENLRPGPTLDLGPLAATPLAELRLEGPLDEVFRVEMRRTTWEVEVSSGNRVEVALDRGEVRRGERAEPVAEVEIESVAGDPMAVFDLAAILLESAPLRPSAVTKAQRGYRLAGATPGAPRKAGAVALDPGMSPAQAARAIAREALDQLQANEAGVRAGGDPEFLHQFRVALRRLRSALSVFRAALEPEALAVREELRWLAALTGPARDWDVFAAATLPALLEAFGDTRTAALMRRRARARARAAGDRLREALVSARYARLLLALARWLATPAAPLAAPRDGESAPPGPAPLALFARRVVRRRHRRLLADARRLSALTPEERHALRLDAKRLRYALEGLASLFRRKAVAAHLEALSEIQDDLGRANDAAVAARLLAELAPPPAFAQFARGWLAAQAHASASGLERHAARLESVRRLRVR